MRILKRRHEYGSKEHETRQKKGGNRKPQIFDDFWLLGDLTPAALLRLPVISPTASTVSRCPVREIQNSGQALAKLKTVGCSSMGHIPHDKSNREIYDEPSNFRGPFSIKPIYIYRLICQHARELVEREFGWCWSPVDVAERSNPTILQIYLFIYLFKPLIFGG